VDTINFITLMDVPRSACDQLKAQAPILEWFCYLGILDGEGAEKPAAAQLAAWKAVPRQP
jgi:hypothetical protein